MQSNRSTKFDAVLPVDFDGVFRFSNPSNEDFIGEWNKKQYLFPAESTVPLIIPEHSPHEIQHIRKKFAKDLAQREWFKSKGYKVLSKQEGTQGNRTMNSIHQAAQYTESDLEPYIQACLKPLKAEQMLSRPAAHTALEDVLKRDESGALISDVVDPKKDSLRRKALEA